MTVTTESKLIPMKWIVTLAYVWLAIPVILFLINWVNLTVNALLALMIIYVGASAFIRRQKGKKTSAISLPAQDFSPALKLDPTLVFTGATLLFLVIYMGIGGLMTQEYNDQVFRNAMLYEVTNRDWPIIYPPIDGNPCFLSYYMGFWLPAAAVAKIFGGNMLVAESVTIFYAWTGLFLFIAFIFSYVGERRRLLALLVILMFAAFDYVAGAIFTYRNYPDIISFIGGNHDNATTYYALPNIAVALGQIYNQAIPAFLGCMLLYYQRNSFRYFFLTFALVMFFSPLQCVGIFPVCAVWGIRNFRNTISAANILGILLCFLFAAYFMANNQGSMRTYATEGDQIAIIAEKGAFWVTFSVAIYLPFLWKSVKRDWVFWLLLAISLAAPLMSLHGLGDLGWRAPTGLSVYLMAKIAKKVVGIRRWTAPRNACFAVTLCLCSLTTAGIYFYRGYLEVTEVIIKGRSPRVDWLNGHLADPDFNQWFNNFMSTRNGFFYKYIMRRPDAAIRYNHNNTSKHNDADRNQ